MQVSGFEKTNVETENIELVVSSFPCVCLYLPCQKQKEKKKKGSGGSVNTKIMLKVKQT